jgi:hypothetical protein
MSAAKAEVDAKPAAKIKEQATLFILSPFFPCRFTKRGHQNRGANSSKDAVFGQD